MYRLYFFHLTQSTGLYPSGVVTARPLDDLKSVVAWGEMYTRTPGATGEVRVSADPREEPFLLVKPDGAYELLRPWPFPEPAPRPDDLEDVDWSCTSCGLIHCRC